MTTQETGWRRDKEGLGLWPHQGKVAITGWGQSPVDRRWDGTSMDKILGAYAIIAVRRALEDAGVKPEEVDGLLCCPDNMAGAGVAGPAGQWGPDRPFFAPPYDSEDGISVVTNKFPTINFGNPRLVQLSRFLNLVSGSIIYLNTSRDQKENGRERVLGGIFRK